MTLAELVVAMTIFAVVITAALGFMTKQNSTFQDSIHRLVVKAGKRVLYDGPVSARAGTVIREGERIIVSGG